MKAWRYEFYFLVAKAIFYSLAALVRKILFYHSKTKLISLRHRVISPMYLAALLADFQINGGVNQILIHGGAFSSSEVLGKNNSIQSKLLNPKLAGLKRKERMVWSKLALRLKRLWYHVQIKVFLIPVEALQCNHAWPQILRQILKLS